MAKSKNEQIKIEKGDNSKFLNNVLGMQTPPQLLKTDDDYIAAIDNYFCYCAENDIKPGIESLCLTLNMTRRTFWSWENEEGKGKSDQLVHAFKKAKQIIAAYYEQLNINGKINPATGIFLLKNWYGYQDNTTLEVANTSLLGGVKDVKALEAKYVKDLPEK